MCLLVGLRLQLDQLAYVESLRGARALAVSIPFGATAEELAKLLNSDALYFFLPAELLTKSPAHERVWRKEWAEQDLGPCCGGHYVRVFDEAHIGIEWKEFRPAFGGYDKQSIAEPMHQTVCQPSIFPYLPHLLISAVL